MLSPQYIFGMIQFCEAIQILKSEFVKVATFLNSKKLTLNVTKYQMLMQSWMKNGRPKSVVILSNEAMQRVQVLIFRCNNRPESWLERPHVDGITKCLSFMWHNIKNSKYFKYFYAFTYPLIVTACSITDFKNPIFNFINDAHIVNKFCLVTVILILTWSLRY